MPHYLCLVTFTHEGLKNLRATTKRAEAFEEKAEKAGLKILNTYWNVGRYDLFHVFDAPDDETAAAMSFSLGVLGNVRVEMMRAFNREEMQELLTKVYTPYDLLS